MITSTTNPLIKQIRRLSQRKYRNREGLFFVEGIRIVLSALEQNAEVETIVYCEELLTSELAMARIEQFGGRVEEVSADMFRTLSTRDNPTGLGAILAHNKQQLTDLSPAADMSLVALHNVENPGNVGTILRTIDAAGADGLILIGQTTDPAHPNAIKASMGAWFNIPIYFAKDLDAFFSWADQHSVTTIGTSANTDSLYYDLSSEPKPITLLMGSEQKGLPADALARTHKNVKIPMHGTSSSLNLAIATGILLFELNRKPM